MDPADSTDLVGLRVAEVAGTSYGRLLALLAAPASDIAAAEDALADAFERALKRWPGDGIPENPDAWLLTVARNRLRDLYRSAAHRAVVTLPADLSDDEDLAWATTGSSDATAGIPDRRLALLFACAHPAIAPAARTPLMLQTVLGLGAARIAAAYTLPESTVAQRLVRAKQRIRVAHVPFVIPDRSAMPARLGAVLEGIYGAYAVDWPVVAGPDTRDTLAAEARYLARTVADLLPDEPEAAGLAALISLSMARLGARVSDDGRFVPLEEQDPAHWDSGLIAEGEQLLRRAASLRAPGRFQLEAAIQSVHCDRGRTGSTNWQALVRLYSALVTVAPTLGARVSLAVALGRAEGPGAGLALLDGLANDPTTSAAVARFQPAWAARAHLLAANGDPAAADAYAKALSLSTDPAVRTYLADQRARLG